MIHLVTHFWSRTPAHEEMFAITSAHNRTWAERLGWQFHSDTTRRLKDPYIYREKSAFISELLPSMADDDLLLWLDGDAIIWRDPSGIWDDLGDADLGMVKFLAERWNSGVCAVRVNLVNRKLWPEIKDHQHDRDHGYIDGPLAENICQDWTGHECKTCPWKPEDRGPLCGSKKTKVRELGRQWNEHFAARDQNTKILGLHMRGINLTLKRLRIAMEEQKQWQP